ncbi:NACHT domain-containing protein [Methylomonas methanica]|uniref:Putative signal transduction protein with Nacht domain n=1 Tax=Methylomonas methanica (strain DSM 25384 / MC09) TaxID=857087 RepID=F9ZXE4_METMM|nr:NACHT domain-containing protein [Methylomonas methanica]AEG00932.1 putative signal transduction protein with Nacht domain [Methylomonas methanica MC09]
MLEDLVKKATGGLDGVAKELVKTASAKIQHKLQETFALQKLEILKKNIDQIGKVKTFLNPESIVNLNDIYYENAINFSDYPEKPISFFPERQVLIEGGPGQGKSLLLRHICIKEAKTSRHIPIFIELRYLKYKKSLKDEIMEAVSDFGIHLDNDVFNYLAKSKKIMLILDGFDEIPSDYRNKAARDLENIARAYPDLKMIVSSRPDSGMGVSFYFTKYKIKHLSVKRQISFIKHIYKRNGLAKNIIKILKESDFLSEVTNTPLLLTLYAITYNARQFNPDSLSEFYSIIFPTMLYRHDRLKLGFERERKSKLTDSQMQRVFEALSFISLNDNHTSFTTALFRKYLAKSASVSRVDENIEDKLIEDFTIITALIVPDGFENFSYAHKSIQEYFSSTFIAKQSEEKKIEFYKSLIQDLNKFRKWQNTLSFLETIDEISYIKNFSVPIKKKALCMNQDNVIKMDYSSVVELLGKESMIETNDDGDIKNTYWEDTLYSAIHKQYSTFLRDQVILFLKSKNTEIGEFISYSDIKDYIKYQKNNGFYIIKIDTFIKKCKLQKAITDILSSKLETCEFKQEVIRFEKNAIQADNLIDQIFGL